MKPMPTEPSLTQLSAYDPGMAIPEDSPLSDLARKADALNQEKPNREKAKAFRATRDPAARKKMLDEMLPK